MEAVAALGIAGNVVQFLDFATKLCLTSVEIYQHNNGASAANDHAETLLKSFVETIDEISRDLGKYFMSLGAASTQAQEQGDSQICLIITDCQKIANDLLQRFNKLKTSGTPGKWKSFLAGIKCIWRKNELEDLHSRLKRNRKELEWRIMLSLREGITMLASRQKDQFSEVQSAIITTLTDVLRDRVPNLPRWPESIEDTLQKLRDEVIAVAASKSQQPERSIVRAATGPRHQLQPEGPFSFANDYAEYCATQLAETEKDRWKSLAYEVMDDREDQIAEAEMKTFEWILQAPRGRQLPWSDFMQWLEAGESIYWISGKAGSGKSTIMKYLNGHHKVRQALCMWSTDAGIPLIMASFYFWYNGTALQKTQEGLLRSLLYQALENHRELIPLVLKGSFDVPANSLNVYWTLPRLKAAFHELVAQKEVPLKICFLIDGLDEYAGEHSEIAEVFHNAAKFENVKIAIMRGISVELETMQSRMKDKLHFGEQGEIKRDAWFDEVRTRKHEATCYAMTVEEERRERYKVVSSGEIRVDAFEELDVQQILWT